MIDRPRDSANRFNQFTVSSDRSTRENYLQSESQHVHYTSYWAFGFFFLGGVYNVNIHLYMIHFWNTLTLRKVQLPTDVSRLNCVFERNGDMIPRAQLFVLWLPSDIALNINLKKTRMSLFSLDRGRWGVNVFKSRVIFNQDGYQHRRKVTSSGVITKWGGGGHISLSCQLPVKL